MFHVLLQTYNAGMQKEWTSRDIFFLLDKSSDKILEACNPYLAYPVLQQQRSESIQLAGTVKFPLLVAFGKLLLEIALGRFVEDSELRMRRDVALLAIIDEQQQHYEMDTVPEGYFNAMTNCLNANFNDNYDEDEDEEGWEGLSEEEEIRKVLFEGIQCLEKAREDLLPSFSRNQYVTNPNSPLELEYPSKDCVASLSRAPPARLSDTVSIGPSSKLSERPIDGDIPSAKKW